MCLVKTGTPEYDWKFTFLRQNGILDSFTLQMHMRQAESSEKKWGKASRTSASARALSTLLSQAFS